jgi:hypothetical protein
MRDKGGRATAYAGPVPRRAAALITTIRTWGSTPAERGARYRCDDLVAGRRIPLFRAIDVAAPPDLAFRWVGQLRLAPYSHDLVDNLGRRSPRELSPGLGPPRPGERAMTIFRVVDVVPGRELTLRLRAPSGRAGRLLGPVWSPAAVTYRVAASGSGSRIVVKYVTADPGGALGLLLRTLLPPGDLVMMRRQLRTLAGLAGRDARRGPPD